MPSKWRSPSSKRPEVVDHLPQVITLKTAHSSRHYRIPKSLLHLVNFGDEVMQSDLEQGSTLGNPLQRHFSTFRKSIFTITKDVSVHQMISLDF
jgi:hypothetical protein